MTNFESITDRPADHLDQANAETERTTALTIAAIRAKCSPAAQSLSECEQCGCEIPRARQEAAKGCKHCIDCARLIDLKANGVRRI